VPDPTWQALYRAALMESDPSQQNIRIDAARQAIRRQLQLEDSGDTRLRQQLNDSLGYLMTLAARRRCA
jgi:hypothetical protein